MQLFRRVLAIATVVVVLLCGGGAALVGWAWNRTAFSTAGEVQFANPLAIPPLAPSRIDAGGQRVFELRAGTGRHDFGDGPVETWGFNGAYLGPTLRAERGEQVRINVHNGLSETTSVHWHGMHVPARMDGGPHQPIEPGQTWSPSWTIDQPAATLWYHPHPHGATARHVYRGLAGMFILDDPEADALDLPHEYGVDDLPVIVQDKRFAGRRVDESAPFLSGVGILGRTIAVNGTVGPYRTVTTERVRLRLLNASNARVYNFGFVDDREFALVGTDGGLLAAPYETDRVRLSPGERAEIVVTMRAGERAVLRSRPPPLGAPFGRFSGGSDTFDILELRAADSLTPSPPVPERLVDVPVLGPSTRAVQRDFRLSGTSINGREMNMSRVDAVVEKGITEVWRVTNEDGMPHSFHIHDVQFQVRSVDGAPPPPQLRGWKDTVYLPPGRPFELVVPFGDYTDPDTPYMFHCHVLRH
ncbi:MAG TPA: multicopper oxidase domain-containing protein, partial [Kribbellaceae bacterium]